MRKLTSPTRVQLEQQIEALIVHCNARGGGLCVALIEINSGAPELRTGTLKTIANSIQLSLRPMDLVARYNKNTFAVLVHYQDPEAFNLDMFDRLIDNIQRQSQPTTEHGTDLQISLGIWHGHELDPEPGMADIIEHAKKACRPV